ncbi:hypothetical protein JAO76_04260 [Pontibacter sp. BT310]|uniref:Catalase n=1 Tax=Pontibacter populi TaxID=890055 RepID=A0ABS6X8B2_9BACT|nr:MULTISPECIES: hypothetical protein [Pontibacter]MBJ6117389.1 hypothetical protein [Pontibacter sp. BT310]MBR0569814.1 hypothetical protein [Microvirga sp. STS03]MBW3364242.1 hypothetical protein [Pontibacter populi]
MKPDNKNQNQENKATNKQEKDPEVAGTGKANKEPTLRSYTTDSSRSHESRHDDMATGGNIR